MSVTQEVTAEPAPRHRSRDPLLDRLIVIDAGHTARNYWSDLWRYRDLFMILAWRDLAVRHKQTVMGVAWSLIRPLATVIIFTFVFGRVAKLASDGSAPYSLMVFAGLLPWTLITNIVGQTCGTVQNNAAMMNKVYFPRLILPGATIAVSLVDAAISLVLLLCMMAWFGFWPDWRLVFLPAFILLAILASLGPALWVTAVNVKYRDFQYVVGFALQFGLYLSPVGFSSSAIPEQWRLLYSLNPAVGVIDGFRWCLFRGEAQLYLPGLTFSLVITAALLWAGVTYFRKAERTFVDLI